MAQSKQSGGNKPKSTREILVKYIKAAYDLAQRHSFEGARVPDIDKPKRSFYTKTRKNGSFMKADDGEVQGVFNAAKDAKDDLQSEKYSQNVVDLINTFENWSGRGGGGAALAEIKDLEL